MRDLINRQDAIDAILSIKDYGNSDRANALGLAEFAITTLPPVKPEQKKGKWLLMDGYRCSCCYYGCFSEED